MSAAPKSISHLTMSSSGGPPISLEETVIGAALSSSMLSLLLMGWCLLTFGLRIVGLKFIFRDLQRRLLWYSLHIQFVAELEYEILTKLNISSIVSRKPSRSWIVLGTITMLYVVYVLQIAVEWFLLRRALVDDGQTQESAFAAALSSPGWNTLLNDICNLFLSAFADGLLVRRDQIVYLVFN